MGNKFVLFILIILLYPSLAFGDFGKADSGTLETHAVNITKIEIKNDSGEWISIHEVPAGVYLDTLKTSGENTFHGAFEVSLPEDVYTGIRFVGKDMRIKAEFNVSGTQYYTKAGTYNWGDSLITTDSSLYGDATIIFPEENPIETEFLSDINVQLGNSYNLTWLNDPMSNSILLDGGDTSPDATQYMLLDYTYTFVTGIPAKAVEVSLEATHASDPTISTIVILYFDDNDSPIGSACYRDLLNFDEMLINCLILKTGSVTNVTSNADSADFNLTFPDSDGNPYLYTFEGSYNCSGSATSSFDVKDTTGDTVDYFVSEKPGYVFQSTATSVVCKDLSISGL